MKSTFCAKDLVVSLTLFLIGIYGNMSGDLWRGNSKNG